MEKRDKTNILFDEYEKNEKWEIRKGIFTEPPKKIPHSGMVDAPLMGNGDVGIAIGGGAHEQTFYIGKNDFWVQAHIGETFEQRKERLLNDTGRRTGARIITVGQLNIHIPWLQGATYIQEQDIYNAEVVATYKKDGFAFKTCSWVSAVKNLLITEIELVPESYIEDESFDCKSKDEIQSDFSLLLHAGEKGTGEVFAYSIDKCENSMWFKYAANPGSSEEINRVFVATRVLGAQVSYLDSFADPKAHCKIISGKKAYIVTSVVSNRDSKEYMDEARGLVENIKLDDIDKLKAEHRAWWKEYWRQSFVDIGDPVLEKYYYASYYIMACCSRKGKVPPGIFGNWITTDRPKWTGSYTMNYNYEAPFWGMYSGNRLIVEESYYEPLLDIIPIGKFLAREKLDCRGVYLPVELGPSGTVCSTLFHSQKSNASFAAVNILMHFYHTWDMEYASKVYQYLKETADFWEDYLKYEEGRYIIYNDCVLEAPTSEDKNPIISLGMIRMLLKGLLIISSELGVDSDRHEKWNHILEHLSNYALQEMDGKIVFRYTESGTAWGHRNTLGIQHVFPAGQIGLGSDTELLEIARNTLIVLNRWDDFNGFPTYYTAAARLGYDPEEILNKLREQCELHGMPNLVIFHGGGGIEDCGTVPTCINEMLLQSHENILRFFPVWPEEKPANFYNLRTHGAFLVTSSFRDGKVQHVFIKSESGRKCTIENPWKGKTVTLYRNGIKGESFSEDIFMFNTAVGENIELINID